MSIQLFSLYGLWCDLKNFLPLVELARKCQKFPFSQLFLNILYRLLKKDKAFENFDIHNQVQLAILVCTKTALKFKYEI